MSTPRSLNTSAALEASQAKGAVSHPSVILSKADEVADPFMAVIKVIVAENPPATITTHVLMSTVNGLCTPHVFKQEEVYLLSLYTDGTTTAKGRGENRNKKALKLATQAGTSRLQSAKGRRHATARDQTKLILPPNTSLSYELGALLSAYELEKSPWCINEMISVLEQIDNDLTLAPWANPAIHAFADAADDEAVSFSPEQAARFVKEAQLAWMGVETLGAHLIYLLSRGLRSAEIFPPYTHFQSFVLEGCYLIQQAIDRENVKKEEPTGKDEKEEWIRQLGKMAKQAEGTVLRVLGFASKSLNPEEQSSLLIAVKKKLEEVVDTDKEFGKMVSDAAGDMALDSNYQDIWSGFSGAPDTDSARAAFMAVVKLLVAALSHKEGRLGQMVRDIVDILEKAGV